MKVYYFEEVLEFLARLNEKERARISRTREFFEKYGFGIGPKYIKKVKSNLWELRAGNVRLFLGVIGGKVVGVHIVRKKSQKLPLKDVRLAEKRSKEI
ncbi:MAG: hypothetical protein ACD_57C00391G0014 [uncultured bacterium]|uniref:Addiction module toxin RelE n=1 Tax=Candidatus Woesebacteria bacterium RIFCSPHIGHO2_12_FULL_41_24 TaxID=1802510 RepID=A0A1F8ASE5_9BACT|nr:MAG: hypothetical protein ACD_57C00391G0014 [uncultured bacterium]OGM12941.1 MAG: hypothetical protein A2W15_01085 [Candidatus Woesebacteria bacterium RBG_16_41_13]OGM28781.1 MAG: hypothetical protein A2873_01790 [Candidatus Woesebacteria bacterium RIFCSPHIGHO2_01_FULL_42_80]OGM34981.1 MAG: hypothetical protein A3D84_06135 [Candidatus Woesebacteria bacterium RIFCSPHIGHO2_02_FULL_42_20]OGM54672.1 MAG: hypothetical protein A3E44_02495 [Candidatus Woesebacteria bacterium RIFCSPHIGHO2_12_FULL_41